MNKQLELNELVHIININIQLLSDWVDIFEESIHILTVTRYSME